MQLDGNRKEQLWVREGEQVCNEYYKGYQV